jgi:site-specific DNA recombinase
MESLSVLTGEEIHHLSGAFIDCRAGYARPFDALTSREVQADALTWADNARNENEVRTPPEDGSSGESSHLAYLG